MYRRKLSYAAAALAGLVLLGTLGVVGYERQVHARIDRLLASGTLPARALPDPAAESLARDLERLYVELERVAWGAGDLPPEPRTPFVPRWQEEQREEWAQLVDTAAPVLDELDQLLESPQARLILDTPGSFVPRSDRQPRRMIRLRGWANALSARAIANARRGEHEQSARSLRHACDLTRLIDDGSVISLMLQIATQVIAFDAAGHIIERHPNAAAALRRELDMPLTELGNFERAKQALEAELGTFLERIGEQTWWDYDLSEPRAFNVPKRALFARWLDLLLDDYKRLALSSPGSYESRSLGKWDAPVPPWSSALDSAAWQRRRAEHFRLALAATAYRDRHGAWPASLDELAPDFDGRVPVDPSTGLPFHYEVGPDCVLLAPEDPAYDHFDESDSPWVRCTFTWRVSNEQGG